MLYNCCPRQLCEGVKIQTANNVIITNQVSNLHDMMYTPLDI